MADLKKCDICGTTYKGHKLCSDTHMTSSSIHITDYGDYSGDVSFKNYELCPSCIQRFLIFVEHMTITPEKE